MDSQPIQPTGKPELRQQERRLRTEGTNASAKAPESAPSDDTVSLSPASREKLEGTQPKSPAGETPDKQDTAASPDAADRTRKFTITEENDVVVKILDNQTKEVVKQIPSEDELKLKEGIRTVVENLSGKQSPDLNI